MLLASWSSNRGWAEPKIVPYGPIPLMLTASLLQYATECFEGMKLFRGYDGRLRLFRPGFTCDRLLSSATRISLPSFDPDQLLQLIHKICALEGPKWLPRSQPGSFLYIRPTFFGNDSCLGFKAPDEALICIFVMQWPLPNSSSAATKDTPPRSLRLLASSEHAVRAFPGGTGSAKIGANYGPALQEHELVRSKGFDQVLWLYGPDREITEAGSTNFFVILRDASSGRLQIITPPLTEHRLILSGGTRPSILTLALEMFVDQTTDVEPCETVERRITMTEVEAAAAEARLEGVFVVGTATGVQPVHEISFVAEACRFL
jgi:branched-chain amino acid aminotransferase